MPIVTRVRRKRRKKPKHTGNGQAPRHPRPEARTPPADSAKADRRAGLVPSSGSRGSRVVGLFRGTHIVAEVAEFFARYIVLPPDAMLVAATWTVSAWLADYWDRFPHLAATSPEKRCGKTRFLQILELLTPNPYNTANISPAALYRLVEMHRPTLLLDEAQSIARRGSEASEVLREILNAGIDRKARIIRCGGNRMNELREFRIYAPKAVALIGELDGVLADRCLPLRFKRKTADQIVERYRSRVVEPEGERLAGEIETWAEKHGEKIAEVYDRIDPFDIENDRMAELIAPLQAVLTYVDDRAVRHLERYARALDGEETDRMSSGVLLLAACREIFRSGVTFTFVSTDTLIANLADRREEPWGRWNRGQPITAEGLARLLRPFGITPDRKQKKKRGGKVQTRRGYFAEDFSESWARYLPARTDRDGRVQ